MASYLVSGIYIGMIPVFGLNGQRLAGIFRIPCIYPGDSVT